MRKQSNWMVFIDAIAHSVEMQIPQWIAEGLDDVEIDDRIVQMVEAWEDFRFIPFDDDDWADILDHINEVLRAHGYIDGIHYTASCRGASFDMHGKVELSRLQAAIDAFNDERQCRFLDYGGSSDCYYMVEEDVDDRYGVSYLITFIDPDEEFTSDLCLNQGLENWMERFTAAVRQDTDDNDFLFEPCSYGGPWVGRAYVSSDKLLDMALAVRDGPDSLSCARLSDSRKVSSDCYDRYREKSGKSGAFDGWDMVERGSSYSLYWKGYADGTHGEILVDFDKSGLPLNHVSWTFDPMTGYSDVVTEYAGSVDEAKSACDAAHDEIVAKISKGDFIAGYKAGREAMRRNVNDWHHAVEMVRVGKTADVIAKIPPRDISEWDMWDDGDTTWYLWGGCIIGEDNETGFATASGEVNFICDNWLTIPVNIPERRLLYASNAAQDAVDYIVDFLSSELDRRSKHW